MNRVIVLDTNKQQLAPCHPARARELLRNQQASVYRKQPFTIILKHTVDVVDTPTRYELKIDPGSKTTGVAVVQHTTNGSKVVMGINLQHRGHIITQQLLARRQLRSSRRSRNLRHRPARYNNRRRSSDWLPPSIQSRLDNVRTVVNRLLRTIPITSITMEDIKFDPAKMTNNNIHGKEYQNGTLVGTEIKEYLLAANKGTCQYCHGKTNDNRLEVEHVHPKSRGGSNSVTNLTLACRTCNIAKSNMLLPEWKAHLGLSGKPLDIIRISVIDKLRLNKTVKLKDATVMNVLRKHLKHLLESYGLPVEYAFGYVTKYNRTNQKHRKDHWIDAACVGTTGTNVYIHKKHKCLTMRAMQNNNRQMCLSDKYGFPRTRPKGPSNVCGYRTGDLVNAVVPRGKYIGSYTGRISVRTSGYFGINKIDVNYKYMKLLQANDNYKYSYGTPTLHNIIHRENQNLSKLVHDIGAKHYTIQKMVKHGQQGNTVRYLTTVTIAA